MYLLKTALVNTSDKAESSVSLLSVLPQLFWFLLALSLLLAFRREIRAVLQTLAWRIRIGAPVKVFSFELGSTYAPAKISQAADESSLAHRIDADDERYTQRSSFYEPNRYIFLVHRLAPSRQAGMLYDIQLYLVPHKNATLVSVASVEYYFGKSWGSQIFTSTDRAKSFLITTSAYGPFVCTAKLCFTDGTHAIVARYVDFEMGSIGTEA